MSADEFREKMKNLGWDNEDVESVLKLHEKAKKQGIIPPALESYVKPVPIINN